MATVLDEELMININDATEYIINAEGKSIVSLNISKTGLSYTTDGQDLTITTADGKTITLKNIQNLKTLKTDEGETDELENPILSSTDLTQANIINTTLINTALSKNNYAGSQFNDIIDASLAPELTTTKKVKKGNKTIKKTVKTGIGVNIDAGDGDDTITGSAFNDTITGGKGTNTYLIDTTKNFGTDTINLTEGETVKIQLLGDENNNPGMENLIFKYEQTGRDFILVVYGENLEYNAQGELITEGHTPRGTLIFKDYFVKNAVILGYDENGIQLKDGDLTLDQVIQREYQNCLDNVVSFAGGNSYSGSRFDDTINAENANQVIKYKKKKVKNKKVTTPIETGIGVNIDALDGDDTITGSRYNDTLKGGEGTNTIKLSTTEWFGNDTVVLTKGENLKFEIDKNNKDYVTYDMVNQNLVLSVYDSTTEHNETHLKGTVTIQGYGANDFEETSILLVQNDNETVLDNIKAEIAEREYSHEYTENSNYTYIGTRFDDKIDAENAGQVIKYKKKKVKNKTVTTAVETGIGVNINAGDGNDTITGSQYDDTITGGKGDNIINLSVTNKFGNDTVYLSENEVLKLTLDSTVATQNYTEYEVSGNDLIITVYDKLNTAEDKTVMGTVKIKDFAGNKSANTVELYNKNGLLCNFSEIITETAEVSLGGGTYIGTNLDDTINAENANQVIKYKKKKVKNKKVTTPIETGIGVNIDALDGDDTITGSRYNDTLKGGEGTNTIKLSTTEWFGNDTVVLTKGENLKFEIDKNNKDYVTYDMVNQNLVLSVYDSTTEHNETHLKGTVTIQGYGANDFEETSILLVQNDNETVLDNIKAEIAEREYSHEYTENSNYTYIGTRFDDKIDAENAGQVIKYKKKKVKNKTVTTAVETGIGVNINAGDGNDTITGSQYDDTITGGKGDNIIVFKAGDNGSFGNDTIFITKTKISLLIYLKLGWQLKKFQI